MISVIVLRLPLVDLSVYGNNCLTASCLLPDDAYRRLRIPQVAGIHPVPLHPEPMSIYGNNCLVNSILLPAPRAHSGHAVSIYGDNCLVTSILLPAPRAHSGHAMSIYGDNCLVTSIPLPPTPDSSCVSICPYMVITALQPRVYSPPAPPV